MHRLVRVITASSTLAISYAAMSARTAFTASAAPTDSVTVIHAGTMLDGRGASQRSVYVVVRGGRIERVSTTPVKLAGATTIELGSATLLPGLIDAHVHPGWYVDRQGKRNSQRSGDTPAQAALARAGNLYATLMAGVTTIQSVAEPKTSTCAMPRRVAAFPVRVSSRRSRNSVRRARAPIRCAHRCASSRPRAPT